MSAPRLGFVGAGWIGRMRLDTVAEGQVGEVAAVCDADPERARAAAEAHAGAVVAASFEEMVARAPELRLNGLVIATPNALHAPQAIAALDAGLAVFCQKPLALNADEARAMAEAGRRNDRLVAVDYSYRRTDGMRELHRLARTGELGRILSVQSVFHNAHGPDKAWWRDPALAGGGALMDLGVHVIDLALWVLGYPGIRAVHGRAFRRGQPLDAVDIDDFATARLELEGEVAADIAVSWNAHAGADCAIRTTVHGTNGGAEFRNVGGSFFDFELVRYVGRTSQLVTSESRTWLGRAIVAWARQLAESAAYDPTLEESIVVAEVIDAIYQPAASTAHVREPLHIGLHKTAVRP